MNWRSVRHPVRLWCWYMRAVAFRRRARTSSAWLFSYNWYARQMCCCGRLIVWAVDRFYKGDLDAFILTTGGRSGRSGPRGA